MKPAEAAKVVPRPEEKKPAEQVAKPNPPPPPKVVDPRPNGSAWSTTAPSPSATATTASRSCVSARPNPTPPPRAVFLQAQACIAVGKYREAVQLINEGLLSLPNWPDSGFRPKVELYGNQEDRWKEHRTRLELDQREQPKNADYLFLLGYLAWFDGERVAAIAYFQQSRGLAVNPCWSDVFLKAGKI